MNDYSRNIHIPKSPATKTSLAEQKQNQIGNLKIHDSIHCRRHHHYHHHHHHHHHIHHHQEDGVGEIFGVILSRSRSASAAISSSSSYESSKAMEKAKKKKKQRGMLMQSAGEKAKLITMKRSFSVSGGGYCRIHHQHDIINNDVDDDNDEVDDDVGNIMNSNQSVPQNRGAKKKKKKDKILKTCRRLLGIY